MFCQPITGFQRLTPISKPNSRGSLSPDLDGPGSSELNAWLISTTLTSKAANPPAWEPWIRRTRCLTRCLTINYSSNNNKKYNLGLFSVYCGSEGCCPGLEDNDWAGVHDEYATRKPMWRWERKFLCGWERYSFGQQVQHYRCVGEKSILWMTWKYPCVGWEPSSGFARSCTRVILRSLLEGPGELKTLGIAIIGMITKAVKRITSFKTPKKQTLVMDTSGLTDDNLV